jgi:CHAD domain-containing protein
MKPAEKALDQFVEESLRERLKNLAAAIRKTAKDPKDVKNIHDLRVAIRRYTQGLRIFRPLLKDPDVKKMRRRLRKVMDLCGAARNCDIAAEVIRQAGSTIPPDLQNHLDNARSHAEHKLAELLKNSNLPRKAKDWKDSLNAQAGPRQTIRSNVRRTLLSLTNDFLYAGVGAAKPEATPADMHRCRLQGKRLRYSLEIFGPLSGPDWQQWVSIVRDLQDYLGKINDCATTRDLITGPENTEPPVRDVQFAVDELMRQRIEAFREYWKARLTANERSKWLAKVRQIGKTP